MKARIRLVFAVQLLLLPFTLSAAGGRDDMWKAVRSTVRSAERKGLPKAAIGKLTRIIEGAMKEKAYPEAIKAHLGGGGVRGEGGTRPS